MGNEAWTLRLDWAGGDDFRATPLVDWKPMAGGPAGLSRSYGGLTFLRVYEAGHMVGVRLRVLRPALSFADFLRGKRRSVDVVSELNQNQTMHRRALGVMNNRQVLPHVSPGWCSHPGHEGCSSRERGGSYTRQIETCDEILSSIRFVCVWEHSFLYGLAPFHPHFFFSGTMFCCDAIQVPMDQPEVAVALLNAFVHKEEHSFTPPVQSAKGASAVSS